jgi:hypothetical protein
MRAAGSKGAADLALVHPEHGLAWAQVGTANKRLGPDARERLVKLAELSGALPLLITTAPGVRPKAYIVTRDVPSRWQPWPLIQITDPLPASGSSASCKHAWDYSNTPGVNVCTSCHALRDWPKGMD